MQVSLPPEIVDSLRCILDPVTFTSRLIKIETPDGLEEWTLDSYQKRFLRDISRHRIVNKSKKVGFSTITCADAIYNGYTIPGLQIIFVATGQRFARELLGKMYDEIFSMPHTLQPKFTQKRIEECSFPNGAHFISLPSSEPDHIRGFGLRGSRTYVYLDEHAHVPNDKDLWTVVRDFMRIGGNITSLSTPKGKRGKFYEIAEPLQVFYRGLTAIKPKTIWSYHEIPWWKCPRHAKAGEASLREGIDEITFQQEYCTNFIDESMSFFPFELIWQCQNIDELNFTGPFKNPVYFGIDFGKQISETIIFVVEEYKPDNFRTIYIECLGGVDYPNQIEVIKTLNNIYHPDLINVDASGPGGSTIVDFLNRVEDISPKLNGYLLTNAFKERIIIRLRMMMEHKRIGLPTKDCPGGFGEKLENQLHSMMRTTTQSGEHTKYSGKETGMDDMPWGLALAIFKEYENKFDPMWVEEKDSFLKKITKHGEDTGRMIRQWVVGV
jgi:hypothetical protein